MPEKFVAYIVTQEPKESTRIMFSQQSFSLQENRINDFLKNHPQAQLLKTFSEPVENAKKNHWEQLKTAVDYCINNHAHLILGELRNHPGNDDYANEILRLINETKMGSDLAKEDFIAEIYCLDQPMINAENFAVFVQHAKQQKLLHGELIKAGLQRTIAKSGNPHASEMLSKVNKPKIDHAITFAILLQPVIAEYQAKGYSQRKMVNALNDAGFTAPEGGPWVLSQLQKVLDRIKVNECALSLEQKLVDYQAQGFDLTQMTQALNNAKIPCVKGEEWTQEMVTKVKERITQIHDILEFNDFLITLSPIFEKFNMEELTENVFKHELKNLGIHNL